MAGFVDWIDGVSVRGWCDTDVEVLVDRRFVIDPNAGIPRPDLESFGVKGVGFEVNIASALPGYVPSEIIVRPRGFLTPLSGGYLRVGALKPFQYVGSDAEARTHNERLMAGAVRGVCLFTSRSGGTWLTDMIASHPRAYALAEPIEGFVRGGKGAFLEWLEDYFLLPSMVEYPRSVQEPALMFMSTKIYQHDTDLFPAFNRYGVKYLRLYRENLVKQAVSDLVAKSLFLESRNFNLKRENLSSIKAYRRIYVDPKRLLALIERYQAAEKVVDDMIDAYAEGDVMATSYESLQVGVGFEKVFDYFGLDFVGVQSRFLKINSDDLSDVVENFEEVMSFMSRTRYAHYVS
ncbi:hypothetical protein LLG90_08380 [Aromatoleum toluclasticum]|uniref:hypothetical protein n=1 Tax=Aromatoleum toluclasticum TaxID=92003 RepID=UPI001D17E102|nr:hypothetical protein [Aromatoleum toluclasticum]MCC4115361.1 hypothetical protein [Aromatoleum toluclasticum]